MDNTIYAGVNPDPNEIDTSEPEGNKMNEDLYNYGIYIIPFFSQM